MRKTIAVRAHTNLALVKYWGKKDEKLVIPFNSSISMTIDAFYTDTTVTVFDQVGVRQRDFFLDGKKADHASAKRVLAYADRLLERLGQPGLSYIIASTNHVPVSAGLASSSSAFAALGGAFARLLEPGMSFKDISRLVRLGSGSATRSVFGGFVKWQAGTTDADSFAIPLDENPTMPLDVVFLELNEGRKKVSSRDEMRIAVKTSPSYSRWVIEANADAHLLEEAIETSDFSALGLIAERNSRAMHQTTHDSIPPLSYLSADTTKAIALGKALRHNGLECYCTLDAGPNPAFLVERKNTPSLLQSLKGTFPTKSAVRATFGPGLSFKEKVE